MTIAAFDIGGTYIKYGLLNEDGNIQYKAKSATDLSGGGTTVINQLKRITGEIRKRDDLKGIAISTAGQIDPQEGTVIYAADSIPGYTGIEIKKELESIFDVPVHVENDVSCAAMGEYWKGTAQGVDDFLCLTLGTSIGGAIIINGQVYYGSGYSAGEFGHMTLYPNGKPCTCGDEGCYERYASSWALEQQAQHHIQSDITLPHLFHRAKEGNQAAESIIDQWANDVALGLKNLVHIFNPSLIVIGGGVSEQGDYLLAKLEQQVYPKVMPSFRRMLRVKMAKNGNDANLQGAVYQLVNGGYR